MRLRQPPCCLMQQVWCAVAGLSRVDLSWTLGSTFAQNTGQRPG